jgi:hypothetical protein
MAHASRRKATPPTGPVKLAWRATQVLHTAGEAKKRREFPAGAKRITQKCILAAFNDKFSFNVL